VKAILSSIIRIFVQAWKGLEDTLVLFVGDHTTRGREITVRMAIGAVLVIVLLPWIKPDKVAYRADKEKELTEAPPAMYSSGSFATPASLVGGAQISFREWVYLTGTLVALLSGGLSFKRFVTEKSLRKDHSMNVVHGVEGFALIKLQLLQMIEAFDPHVKFESARESAFLKPSAKPINCISAYFDDKTGITEIYCEISQEHIPQKLSEAYPGAVLSNHPSGNVLISISHSNQLDQYKGLLHCATLKGKRKA
jgi:hypothetical protein